MADAKIGVLFVCMGNICRSPMARGVFEHMAQARGRLGMFDIDSCGTSGFHVGNAADGRTVTTLAGHGISLVHRARQFRAREDLARFTHILAMDLANVRQLTQMGCPPERVRLFRACAPDSRALGPAELEVPDPYYGGEDGFEKIYTMIHAASQGLLSQLLGT